MANKNILSRIQHKHDTQANWEKAVNFIPLKGEIIVYDVDGTYSYSRIKIGDGATSVVDLPFINEGELITVDDIDAICGTTIQVATLNNEVRF